MEFATSVKKQLATQRWVHCPVADSVNAQLQLLTSAVSQAANWPYCWARGPHNGVEKVQIEGEHLNSCKPGALTAHLQHLLVK